MLRLLKLVVYFQLLTGNWDYSQKLTDFSCNHRNLTTHSLHSNTKLNATSKLQPTSDKTFSFILPTTPQCFSTTPFDLGDSAPVVYTLIFNCSPISRKVSLLNSPPLSHKNNFGVPNNAIQCLNILSTITSFRFVLIIAPALNLVA